MCLARSTLLPSEMKVFSLAVATQLLFCAAQADVTPLNQPLADQHLTNITCELTQPPKYAEIPVFTTPEEAESMLGVYHYTLWLPEGYSADPGKSWPCMFIMSAGGDATMGAMETWLKDNHFIVVMLVEARNGTWAPILGNFLAAHDDVIKRVRVADGQKYATGVSGGARASSIFVQLRPGFCGLILQAAGVMFDNSNNYITAGLKRDHQLHIAMLMGTADDNVAEIDPMKKAFGDEQLAVFPFPGGHAWAPSWAFAKAMTWLLGKSSGNPATSPGDSFDDFFKKK